MGDKLWRGVVVPPDNYICLGAAVSKYVLGGTEQRDQCLMNASTHSSAEMFGRRTAFIKRVNLSIVTRR